MNTPSSDAECRLCVRRAARVRVGARAMGAQNRSHRPYGQLQPLAARRQLQAATLERRGRVHCLDLWSGRVRQVPEPGTAYMCEPISDATAARIARFPGRLPRFGGAGSGLRELARSRGTATAYVSHAQGSACVFAMTHRAIALRVLACELHVHPDLISGARSSGPGSPANARATMIPVTGVRSRRTGGGKQRGCRRVRHRRQSRPVPSA